MDRADFRITFPDETGHEHGEVIETCEECGKPRRMWLFVKALGRLLPCSVSCDCIPATRSLEVKMRRARVPERFIRSECETLPDKRSAYLFGPPRSGKTTAACCMIRCALLEKKSALFTTMKEIADHELSNKAGSRDFLELLRSVDFLVIDDLGKGTVGEWAVNEVFAVVNDRYCSMRDLCITSNYSLAQLATALAKHSDAALAQSIARRISDVCTPYQYGQQRMRI